MTRHISLVAAAQEQLHARRGLAASRTVPCMALTAEPLPDDRERSVEEGFTVCLAKSFEPEELIRLVARALKR